MRRGALYAGLGVAALLFLLPLYVMIATAFKPLGEVIEASLLAPPLHWTWLPLRQAWSSACIGAACDGLAAGFWTSLCIAVPAVGLSVALGAVNGYALTQWRVPGANLMFALLLAGNFIPLQTVLLPMALLLRHTGLFGTLAGLVVVHVIYGMPTSTLLFRNFYLAIPADMIRAARLDGGRFWSIFGRIIMPLSPPMLGVAVVLQFTLVWNDYLLGLVFGGRAVPVTVLLDNLINDGLGEKQYNVNMAAVLLAALPPLLVYLFAGKWFFRGLATIR
jgi:glucose/mannose transport system permease protein